VARTNRTGQVTRSRTGTLAAAISLSSMLTSACWSAVIRAARPSRLAIGNNNRHRRNSFRIRSRPASPLDRPEKRPRSPPPGRGPDSGRPSATPSIACGSPVFRPSADYHGGLLTADQTKTSRLLDVRADRDRRPQRSHTVNVAVGRCERTRIEVQRASVSRPQASIPRWGPAGASHACAVANVILNEMTAEKCASHRRRPIDQRTWPRRTEPLGRRS
jgi:hypothetical protein